MVEAVLEVHQAAEAEQSLDVLVAAEGTEHAGEVVGGGDLGAEAAAERLTIGAAAEVVVTTRPGWLGNELELAGACLELDDLPGQVAQVVRIAFGAMGVEVAERLLEPHEVLFAHRGRNVDAVGQLAGSVDDASDGALNLHADGALVFCYGETWPGTYYRLAVDNNSNSNPGCSFGLGTPAGTPSSGT